MINVEILKETEINSYTKIEKVSTFLRYITRKESLENLAHTRHTECKRMEGKSDETNESM